METDSKTKVNFYLTFKIGEEEFGVHVSKVLNILELQKIIKVPKAPYYMKGVINLRGTVLPIIDTRLKFGMQAIEINSNTCILVLDVKVEGEPVKVGALVDSVEEVLKIIEDQIQPPPGIGSKYKSEFIYGMAKSNDDFIMLLDMNKVFSVDDVIDLKSNLSEKEDVLK